MTAPHLVTGRTGEEAAVAFLRSKGCRIVACNWHDGKRGGVELDIVCMDGETLVFAEVKTRQAGGRQSPCEALTVSKQRKLIKAAQQYLTLNDGWELPCRFDLLAVLKHGDRYEVEHYEHAFDLSQPVGGGNTAWQPW